MPARRGFLPRGRGRDGAAHLPGGRAAARPWRGLRGSGPAGPARDAERAAGRPDHGPPPGLRRPAQGQGCRRRPAARRLRRPLRRLASQGAAPLRRRAGAGRQDHGRPGPPGPPRHRPAARRPLAHERRVRRADLGREPGPGRVFAPPRRPLAALPPPHARPGRRRGRGLRRGGAGLPLPRRPARARRPHPDGRRHRPLPAGGARRAGGAARPARPAGRPHAFRLRRPAVAGQGPADAGRLVARGGGPPPGRAPPPGRQRRGLVRRLRGRGPADRCRRPGSRTG